MAMWPNLTGQSLGNRFRIGEKQPASLLWEVYKGIDTTNQKPVIIKLLPPGLAHNERFRARFINIWHAVKQLKNDNILIPLLMGIEGDYAFSIVEPVNGITLRNYLRKLKTENRSIDIEEAQSLMRQTAGALHSAHQAGVTHGDLNPDNVLLEKLAQPVQNAPYRVRLTDFSLMKLTAVFDESGQAAQRNWAYISPEHLSNMADVNEQSDIYLAGILFYEVIAGQPPFSPTHHTDAVAKHTHEAPPDIRPYHAGISTKLEDIIYKCLEKKPEDRYQNANEIVSALQPTARVPAAPPPAVISPPPAPAPPPTPEPPPARTDDVIQVTIDPATMVVKVEQPKSVNLTVFNQSSLTDHFSIHLSGIPQEWYTVSSEPLRLNPGDKDTDTIAFKVPKSSSSTAGKHDVELHINPIKQKLQPKIITLSLTVEPFYEYALDLEPTLLKRSKTLLTITNKSNDANTYNLHATDPAHDLDFEIERQVRLEPGDKVSIPVGVKAKQRPWLGAAQHKPFEIEVTSSKVQNPPPPQRGTLIVNPRIPHWVVMLVPLLLLVGAALAFLVTSNIQSENATATAVANTATALVIAQQASQSTQAAADAAAAVTAAAVQTASAHQTATAEWNKADPDEDGLTNQQEQEHNTLVDNPDSDDDGLTDGDEIDRYDTKPLISDSDNDRLSDGDEIDKETDPNNRDSDRDTILDGSDDCPNEGNLGTGVDSQGCPREATPQPTPVPTTAPSGTTPQQAYEMYWYSVINDQNHDYGWNHQTARFQRANSLTFEGFEAWASQWQSVTVSNVNTICEANNLAVVRSVLTFTPVSGGARTTVNGHHQLQLDSRTGEWFFNSSDPGSFGCDRPVP